MASTKLLKQINVEKVKSAIINSDIVTKNSLAEITGLSVATCGNIIRQLLETGEIIEIELAESTGGRPSRRFVYNKNFLYIAVLYVRKEGDNMSLFYQVVTLTDEVIEEELISYEIINMDVIDSVAEDLLGRYPSIQIISIGVPGVVNDNVIDICDIKALCGIDISEHFNRRFNLLAHAGNDVNITALGYYHNIAKNDDDNLVYIYYPINGAPGAGIIVNGNILQGNTNFSGEVSYLSHYIIPDKNIIDEKNKFRLDITKTIMTINCLINPKNIVISGFDISDNLLNDINKNINKYIPHRHIPKIIFEEDIHENYINGLVLLAKEQILGRIKIIEK